MPELAQLDRAALAATNRAPSNIAHPRSTAASIPTTRATTTTETAANTTTTLVSHSNQVHLENFSGDQVSASFSSATAGGRRRRQLRGNGGNVIGQLLASLDLRFADPKVESLYYNYYAQVKRNLLPTAIQVVLLVNLLQLSATCLHFYFLSGQNFQTYDEKQFNRTITIVSATEDEMFFKNANTNNDKQVVGGSSGIAFSRSLFIPVTLQLFILVGTFMMLKMVKQELDPSRAEKFGRRRFSSAGFGGGENCANTGGKGGKQQQQHDAANQQQQRKQQKREQITNLGDESRRGKSVVNNADSETSGDEEEDNDDDVSDRLNDTHIRDYKSDEDDDEDDDDNEDKALKGNKRESVVKNKRKEHYKSRSENKREKDLRHSATSGLSTSLSLTIDPKNITGAGHSFSSESESESSTDSESSTASTSSSSSSAPANASSSHSNVEQQQQQQQKYNQDSLANRSGRHEKSQDLSSKSCNKTAATTTTTTATTTTATTTTSVVNSFTTNSASTSNLNSKTAIKSERRRSSSHGNKLSRFKLSLPYILWFCQVLQLASGLWPQQSFISYSMLLLYSYTIYVIFPIRLMSCILLALGLSLSQPFVDYILMLNLQSTLTYHNVLVNGILPTTTLYASSQQLQQQINQTNQRAATNDKQSIGGNNIFEAQFLPLASSTSEILQNEPVEKETLLGGNELISDLSNNFQQATNTNSRFSRNVVNLLFENTVADDNILVMDHSLLIPMTSQLSKVSYSSLD